MSETKKISHAEQRDALNAAQVFLGDNFPAYNYLANDLHGALDTIEMFPEAKSALNCVGRAALGGFVIAQELGIDPDHPGLIMQVSPIHGQRPLSHDESRIQELDPRGELGGLSIGHTNLYVGVNPNRSNDRVLNSDREPKVSIMKPIEQNRPPEFRRGEGYFSNSRGMYPVYETSIRNIQLVEGIRQVTEIHPFMPSVDPELLWKQFQRIRGKEIVDTHG